MCFRPVTAQNNQPLRLQALTPDPSPIRERGARAPSIRQTPVFYGLSREFVQKVTRCFGYLAFQFGAGELVQDVADDGEAGVLFGVGAHAEPRGAGGVGGFEHFVASRSVIIPFFLRDSIQRADLQAG